MSTGRGWHAAYRSRIASEKYAPEYESAGVGDADIAIGRASREAVKNAISIKRRNREISSPDLFIICWLERARLIHRRANGRLTSGGKTRE